jgi:8-oxo-dGTP pyrophosphatase MutT (NUDIX family)
MSVAKLIVISEGSYLLLKRSGHPRFSDDPDLPGGAIEDNETPIITAVRELREETGIVCQPGELELLYSGAEYSANQTKYHLYSLRLDHKPHINLSWEHSAYSWVNKKTLLNSSRTAKDTYMHMVYSIMKSIDA